MLRPNMCAADEVNVRQETLDIFNSTTLTYVRDSDGWTTRTGITFNHFSINPKFFKKRALNVDQTKCN